MPSSTLYTENFPHMTPAWSRIFNIVADRAEGAYIYTEDGRKLLDFTCGIGVTNTGHCHPKVVEAIREQAGSFLHAQANIIIHKPMLQLIEAVVEDLSIPYCLLTGETRQRTEIVQRFQSGAAPLFLISLKAGGVGLNLTAADTVIHYDPWWNPAVEAQATDRAHRIGQDQPVFVYKLIAQGTIEEKIMQLQADKHALASQLYTQHAAAPSQWSAADIETLFAP